ncbi:MAG TPA: hypothetical protein PKH95_00180 [Candidatus Magasanikbacteria bacterium]|mgnify:FL=1|nr:hypothetical protein [Candidatus Magasanikbacteria bacterium]
MSDNTVKHLVSFLATICCLLAYIAGYFSGPENWWWTGFSVIIVYGLIYRLID